jgi:hypothetical protein
MHRSRARPAGRQTNVPELINFHKAEEALIAAYAVNRT